MDVQRDPAILKRKRRRQVIAGIIAGIAVIGVSVGVSRLGPAVPSIADSRSVLYYGTVKRGPMVREVRGAGTLIPEEIRWIPATTSGRVDRIVLQPGAEVRPGTVILELTNPDLQQSARSAEMDWKTAMAQLANQKVTLTNDQLARESAIVDFESSYEVALADLQAHQSLAVDGLVSRFAVQTKQAAVNQAKNRLELARKQLASAVATADSQLAPAEASVNQKAAEFERLSRQVADLSVKSTMSGQLQLINVEVGQQVGPGTNLARVSDPTRLNHCTKARVTA